MQDTDKLGMLSINHNSKNRQVAEECNKHDCKSPRQTRGDKQEQFKGKKQEAETQDTQDAKYVNPMVTGNNNKESIASFSELLINQNLIAGTETKKDVTTIDSYIIALF